MKKKVQTHDRFVCWVGKGSVKTLKNLILGLGGKPKKYKDDITLWGIVDTETVGEICGSPKDNQYFCFALTNKDQLRLCEMLNKYWRDEKKGRTHE